MKQIRMGGELLPVYFTIDSTNDQICKWVESELYNKIFSISEPWNCNVFLDRFDEIYITGDDDHRTLYIETVELINLNLEL